jgi:cytochrome b6-f complex iron-sulfur subunit
MAKRLSTKEILEAARKGGPAKAAAETAPAAEAAAEAAVEEQEVASVPEASEAVAAAPAAPAANVPTPSSLGRPLTLKEKLAAARAGGAPAPAAAAKAPAAPPAQKSAAAAAEPADDTGPSEEAPKAVPPPAKPLGRPMTLAEKLAAARGGGAPAAAAPAAGKPAAAKAPAAAAKTAAARVLPPLEKMSDPRDLAEAARQAAAKRAKEIAAEAAAKAPAKPAKAPAKPQTVPPRPTRDLAEASTATAAQPSRRRFLRFTIDATMAWIIAGWLTFTAAISAMTLMTVRFMFPNVLAEPPSTIKIGLPSRYEPEDVNDRYKAEWGFWVVRTAKNGGQDIIYALQSVCTHLGCPPNWLAAEQKFKCPCHGSGFYITGINFEGPAPRPLERFKVSLADDGQIMVDKSQTFKQEVGQWNDPDSFIAV